MNSLFFLLQSFSFVFLGSGFAYVLGIINHIIISRILGPSNLGIVVVGISWINIFSNIATFGLVGYLPRILSYYKSKHDNKSIYVIIRSSFILVFIFALLISLLLMIFKDFFEKKILKYSSFYFFLLLILGNFLISFYKIISSFVRSFKQYIWKIIFEDISFRIFRIFLFFFFLFLFKDKIFAGLGSYLSAYLIVSLVLLLLLHFKIVSFIECFKNFSLSKKITLELISNSWPLFLSAFSLLFISNVTSLMLNIFKDSYSVGLFDVAFKLGFLLSFFALSFQYTGLPILTEYVAKNDSISVKNLYIFFTKFLVLLSLLFCGIILIYSKNIIFTLYGSDYVYSYMLLNILVLAASFRNFSGPGGNILVAFNKTKLNLLMELITALFSFSFNWLLIPKFGAMGSAFAILFAYFIRSLVMCFLVYYTCKIHPFTKEYFLVFLYFLISLGISYWLSKFNYYLGFTFILIFCFCLYLYFPFNREEKEVFLSFLRIKK